MYILGPAKKEIISIATYGDKWKKSRLTRLCMDWRSVPRNTNRLFPIGNFTQWFSTFWAWYVPVYPQIVVQKISKMKIGIGALSYNNSTNRLDNKKV